MAPGALESPAEREEVWALDGTVQIGAPRRFGAPRRLARPQLFLVVLAARRGVARFAPAEIRNQCPLATPQVSLGKLRLLNPGLLLEPSDGKSQARQ